MPKINVQKLTVWKDSEGRVHETETEAVISEQNIQLRQEIGSLVETQLGSNVDELRDFDAVSRKEVVDFCIAYKDQLLQILRAAETPTV